MTIINKIILLFIGIILASCEFFERNPNNLSSDVIAKVNDVEISIDDFQQEKIFINNYIPNIRNLDSTSDNLLGKSIIRKLINDELLYQEAILANLQVTEVELSAAIELATSTYPGANVHGWLDEFGITMNFWRNRIKKMLAIQKLVDEKVYNHINISELEVMEYYKNNTNKFKYSEKRNVQHIQLSSQDVANLVLNELRRGRSFEQLIDTYSVSLDRHNQGYLGDIDRDFLPEIFSQKIFELKPNRRYTELIESPYGYHIFRIHKIIPARQQSLEESKPQITKILLENKSRNAFKLWFSSLKENSEIIENESFIFDISEIQ